MLVWLAEYLANFNLFFSLTVRAIFSFITALSLSLLIGPYFIDWLKKQQINQVVRNYGPKSHFIKCETPTMGGIMIITSIIISVLIWTSLSNPYIWVVLFVFISYGIIGFSDDYYKIARQNTHGISNYWKYFWESIIALTAVYMICTADNNTTIFLFFSKETILKLGIWYVILAYFVIIGTGNAVNLTDGLDGLAIVPTIFVAAGLAFVAWITSNLNLASYLHIAYINLAGELMVICTAIVGSGIGFLWFNAYPAQIFMGDVGSLALGGALGTISVLLRQELLLFIMGGLFVIETISVILQVSSFKLRSQRIFLMVPIHHHYELKGLPEPLIIVRFWIISLMLVMIGLVTLKVR